MAEALDERFEQTTRLVEPFLSRSFRRTRIQLEIVMSLGR